MRKNFKSLLDPRGVTVLKRKVETGELAPEVFKQVIKRQMLKQHGQLRTQSRPTGSIVLRQLLRTLRNPFAACAPKDEFAEETGEFSLAQAKRF